MTHTHTPGPWHCSHETSLHGTKLIYGADGYLIADAGRIHHRTETEMEANARLIAAAPELLEACKSFLSIIHAACEMDEKILRLSELDTQTTLAEIAITKATGGK